jgi:two-component system sensor histidine kinase/response regulator
MVNAGIAVEPLALPVPSPAKILLVDDRSANLLALQAVLDNRGYEIVTAASGQEAVARTLENDFAVILLDVMMPGMDGFETASRIRALEKRKRTPIIFVTAYEEEQSHRGYDAGAIDFLYKPIDPDVLRFKVSVFADLHRQNELVRQYSIQLQTANAALERRIEERTGELRISNEELRQFAYAASHDLKEPLRTMAACAKLLSERYGTRLGSDGGKFIDHIVTAARHMDSLLNDLLAYTTHGNAECDMNAECDAEAVWVAVLMALDVAIRESDAVITHDPLPQVSADFNELLQLFQNLIGNGLKYRREEVPRIHVSAERREDQWLFSVQDNGLGIDPSYSDQIFGIFKRVHGREYPGNGIGLAICKKIVERHNGRIWVESEPAKGSTFFFTLPHRAANGGD